MKAKKLLEEMIQAETTRPKISTMTIEDSFKMSLSAYQFGYAEGLRVAKQLLEVSETSPEERYSQAAKSLAEELVKSNTVVPDAAVNE